MRIDLWIWIISLPKGWNLTIGQEEIYATYTHVKGIFFAKMLELQKKAGRCICVCILKVAVQYTHMLEDFSTRMLELQKRAEDV